MTPDKRTSDKGDYTPGPGGYPPNNLDEEKYIKNLPDEVRVHLAEYATQQYLDGRHAALDEAADHALSLFPPEVVDLSDPLYDLKMERINTAEIIAAAIKDLKKL